MAKGSEFERRISKELSLWATGGKRDDTIWRSSLSGGRATVRRKVGKATHNAAGDLCAMHPSVAWLMDKVCFELKHGYKGWDILDMVDFAAKGTPTFQKFVNQCCIAAEAEGKQPVLILHRHAKKVIIVLPLVLFRDAIAKLPKETLRPAIYLMGPPSWVIVELSTFFKHVKPEHVRAALED